MMKATAITSWLVFLLMPAQDNVDFSVRTLQGDEVQLSSLYQKGPTLVTFWALWCEPCKVELRAVQPLYTRYRNQGFSILAINQDSPKSLSKVRSFLASQDFSFPIALDPNGNCREIVNGQSIPFSLLFDVHGKVAYKRIGYMPGDERVLEEEIVKLLTPLK